MDSKKFTIVSIIIFILSFLVFLSTVYLVFFKPVGGVGESNSGKMGKTQNIEIGSVSTQVGSSGRYYKGTIFIEVAGKKTPKLIEDNMPQIKDSIVSSISYSSVSDITSEKGMSDLKEKIKNNINDIIGKKDVVNVLFTESILQ